MKNLESAIKASLEKSSESNIKIKENVKNLSEEISLIETRIEQKSKQTYQSIGQSLNEFKDVLEKATTSINYLEENEYSEKRKLDISYFATLSDQTNELISFSNNSYKDFIQTFDKEKERRVEIYNKIDSLISSSALDTEAKNLALCEIISNHNNTYLSIIDDFTKKKDDAAESLNQRINEIFKTFNDYLEKLKETAKYHEQDYRDKVKLLKDQYPSFEGAIKYTDLNLSRIEQYFKNKKFKDQEEKDLAFKFLDGCYALSKQEAKKIKEKRKISLMINQLSLDLASSFEMIKHEFSYLNDSILTKFKEAMANYISSFKYEVESFNRETNHNSDLDKYAYDSLLIEEEKMAATSKYEEALSKLNFEYFKNKLNFTCELNLYKKSEDIDEHKYRVMLEKILSEYEMSKKQLDCVYESMNGLLETSKVREELTNLSEFKFELAKLENMKMNAERTLDSAIGEYELRISLLDNVNDSQAIATDKLIETKIKKYQNIIDELRDIRNVNLSKISDQISLETKQRIKRQLQTKSNDVEQEFEAAKKRLSSMIEEDKSIVDRQNQIKEGNEIVALSLVEALEIKEKNLETSLEKIDEYNRQYRLLNENFKEINDFSKNKLKEYKERYNLYLFLLEKRMDERASEPQKELYKIAKHYKDNDKYTPMLKKLDEDKALAEQKLFDNLVDTYKEIDIKNDVSYNYLDTLEDNYQILVKEAQKKYDSQKAEIKKVFAKESEAHEKNILASYSKDHTTLRLNHKALKKNHSKASKEDKKILNDIKKNTKTIIKGIKKDIK